MHNVWMSVLIRVRDVDARVRERLKHRAAQEGVSLNSLLKGLLERESMVPSRAEVVRRIRERGDLVAGSSLDLVWATREERDGQLAADGDRR